MKSFDIVTLTVSLLDKSAHFSGLVPEQKFKRLCLMQEEAESTFLSDIQTRGKITLHNNWRIDRRTKKALQEESISFEAIETRSGTRKISLQLMTTRILSFFCFPSPLQSLKKIKSFQLFKN
jgi:hypothetical protein